MKLEGIDGDITVIRDRSLERDGIWQSHTLTTPVHHSCR